MLSERVTSVCSCCLVNVRACTEGDRVDPTLEMVRVRVNCKGATPPNASCKNCKIIGNNDKLGPNHEKIFKSGALGKQSSMTFGTELVFKFEIKDKGWG